MTAIKTKKAITVFLLLILNQFDGIPLCADTIFLKNGMRMDVERAWKEKGMVKYEMYGTVYSYSTDEVARIETGQGETNKGRFGAEGSGKAPPPEKRHEPAVNHSRKFSELYQDKKWKKAARFGDQLFRQNPQNKSTRNLLARFYLDYSDYLRKKGNLQEEIQALKKSLYYHPKQSEGMKKLTSALVLSATREFSKRDYDAAKMLSLEAAGFDDKNPDPYVLLGKIAYNNDDYNGARLNWKKALRREPDDAAVQSLLRSLEKDRTVEKTLRVYESGNFILKFEGKRKQVVVDRTINVLNRAYQDVGSELSVYPDEKIYVLVYPESDLKKLDYLPDWSAGRYDGKIRISEDMCIKSDYFEAVIYHEYTHSLVHILGGRRVPLWLNEGMAEYMSRKSKPAKHIRSRERLMQSAAETDRLIPVHVLAEINGYGLTRLPVPMIQLVYAQSEAFVTFLVKRYSIYDIKQVIKETGEGVPAETAIKKILHSDLSALDKAWRRELSN